MDWIKMTLLLAIGLGLYCALDWCWSKIKKRSTKVLVGILFAFIICSIGLNDAFFPKGFTKISDEGHVARVFCEGMRQHYGLGVPVNMDEAMMWYRKAAKFGHPGALYQLGLCYYNGTGVPIDKSEAVRLWREAVAQSNTWPRAEWYATRDGEEKAWCCETAKAGLADAQLKLGRCYSAGDAVGVDKAEAVEWYRKAAEHGHAEAQFWLGNCYFTGDGVGVNKAEAVKLFRMAADKGFAKAQFLLGHCYSKGDGVEANKDEAMKWWRKSAEQGDPQAVEMLKSTGVSPEGSKK